MVESALGSTKASRHGREFRQYLVNPPQLETFRDANGKPWPAWAILREFGDGYTVAYDEEDRQFCLVTGGVVVSCYADLMAAINEM